jgi:hypothetical protein
MAGLLETRAIAVLRAYSDESGIHDSAVAFSIAGWIAPASEWQKFARSWGKVLRREGIKNFHMTDLLAGHGEFAGWERERRANFIESLGKAVCSTAALGFSSSIIRGQKGQRRGMARMITEQPYVAAFGRQILGLVGRADSFLRAKQKIGFVFDSQDSQEEWSGRALKLYESMKTATEPLGERVRRLGAIAFESCDGENFLPLHR